MRYAQSLLTLLLASCVINANASAPMTLKTNQTSIVMRSDGSAMAGYTLTSNSHMSIRGITIDPGYQGGNASQMFVQNNTCANTVLAPGASCTFQILINGANQNSTFTLSPRACGEHGTVCATTSANYRIPVVVAQIPSTQTVNAYVAVSTGSNENTVQPINISNNSLGTVIPGFNFTAVVSESSRKTEPVRTSCFAKKSVAPLAAYASSAMSVDGKTLYILNQGDVGTEKTPIYGSVSIVDVSTSPGKITSDITVGESPSSVAVLPNGSAIFVANGNRTVSVIKNGAVVQTITVPFLKENTKTSGVNYVAVNPSGTLLFISDQGGGMIFVYDTSNLNTPVATITATSEKDRINFLPSNMVVSPDGETLYATNTDNTIWAIQAVAPYNIIGSVFATSTEKDNGGAVVANGLAVSPDGANLYVAMTPDDGCDGYVAVINTQGLYIITTIAVQSPVGVSLSPNGALLYVTDNNNNSVSVIDLGNDIATDINVNGQTVNFGVFLG